MSAMITAKLASVCEICMGQAPNGASYNTSRDGYELIAGAGDFGEKKPAPGKWTTAPTKVSKPGDIILCIRATIGDCNWSDKEYCLGRGVAGLRGKTGRLDQGFLWHWLVHSSAALKAMGKGATFPQISKNDIASLPIPLPPLSEQKRIAGILDAADALRSKRREALAQLDTLLQSTFLDMFGDPVTNPMGWEVVKLGEIAERITKGQSPNWQGFGYQEDGALFVTSENVREGHIDICSPKYVSYEFHAKLKGSQLKLGDVLINLVGASIGRSCIFKGFDGPANVNQAVGVVTVRDPIFANYVVMLLQTPQGQSILTGKIVEAARANISLTNLRQLSMPFPPTYLQHHFATIVESVEHQKATMRAHLAELDTLFASLQSRAFNGEL